MGGQRKEFLQNFRAVLQRARDKRLRLKVDKSVGGVHEVEVVGMVLNKDGRKPSPLSVEAVKTMAPHPVCGRGTGVCGEDKLLPHIHQGLQQDPDLL